MKRIELQNGSKDGFRQNGGAELVVLAVSLVFIVVLTEIAS
jgi:hypothetical protein